MLKRIEIPLPTGGVNLTDNPLTIDDDKAVETFNSVVVGNVLETLKPKVPLVENTDTNNYNAGDVIVYRKADGTVKHVWQAAGKVYAWDGTNITQLNTIVLGTNTRARIFQYNEKLYILDGSGSQNSRMYDGTNYWAMGISPPAGAPTKQTYTAGSETREYYYTWYNETWDIESNPSKVIKLTDCPATGTKVRAACTTDPQVGKIRWYRTGEGITVPRRCGESVNSVTPGATVDYTDNSTDVDVAQAAQIEFDHDRSPLVVGSIRSLCDGVMVGNRLFAWQYKGSTLWVSNEYAPHYLPVFPFDQQETAKSGAPIDIEPGDGDYITAVVPWAGGAIVFKQRFAYFVQETELGFFTYQAMNIPGCKSGRSAVATPWGLIYLSEQGVVCLRLDEVLDTTIGLPIKLYTDAMVGNATASVNHWTSATYYGGYYILSIRFDAPSEPYTFMYDGNGWFGAIDRNVGLGSCWYEDTDGILLAGEMRVTKSGIQKMFLTESGWRSDIPANTTPINFSWVTKPYEFTPGKYSRVRQVTVVGEVLAVEDEFGILPPMPELTIGFYDETLENPMDTSTFAMPHNGQVVLGVSSEVYSQYISVAISGNYTDPIRISKVILEVEEGADI